VSRRELKVTFELGEDEDPGVFKAAVLDLVERTMVDAQPFGERASLVAVSVEPAFSTRAKQPKASDWEHCTTLDTVRGEDWLPMQPRGDGSWQLCGVLPTEYTTEYGRVKVRLLWKRELP
jgi:hypothetical protein